MGRPARSLGLTLPVVLLLAVQFVNGVITAPSITFFPVYLTDLGRSAVFLSLVVMVQRIAGLASAVAGGIMSDSYSRKRTIILGEVLYFAGPLAFLSHAPAIIIAVWIAGGLGMGFYSLGSQSSFIDLTDPRFLGILTALYYWAYTIGGTLGNPAGSFLIEKTGYAGFALCLAGLGAVTVLMTALFFKPVEPHGGRPAARSPAGLFGYRDIAVKPPIVLLGLLRLIPTFSYGMLLVFIPLLMKKMGIPNAQIALFASASSICAALAQLIVGRASDRMSPRWPALLSFTVLAVSTTILGLFPQRYAIVFASGTLALSAAWCLSTLVPPMVKGVTRETDRGRVLGYIQFYWNIGMILSGLVGGFLFEAGPGLPFLVSGLLTFPAVALTVVFFRLAGRGTRARA